MNEDPTYICIPCGEISRYSEFHEALAQLEKPAGSMVRFSRGSNVAENLNAGVGEFLAGRWKWFWILNDDHTFDPDILLRLLKHQKPIVGPLCLTRNWPFPPAHDRYVGEGENRVVKPAYLTEADIGQQTVRTVGGAGMLINRVVFERFNISNQPWFRIGTHFVDKLTEDRDFCERATRWFPITIDYDTRLCHIKPMVLVPLRVGTKWMTAIRADNNPRHFMVMFPAKEKDERA